MLVNGKMTEPPKIFAKYTNIKFLLYLVHLLHLFLHSKHILEDQNEGESSISPETSFIAEHERLAAEYYNERALLEEALRSKSKNVSGNTSDDESTEGVECISAEKEPSDDKFHPLRKLEPLKPIPASKKESDEDGVFIYSFFNLFILG